MAEVEKEQEENIDMDVDSVNLHIPINPVLVEPEPIGAEINLQALEINNLLPEMLDLILRTASFTLWKSSWAVKADQSASNGIIQNVNNIRSGYKGYVRYVNSVMYVIFLSLTSVSYYWFRIVFGHRLFRRRLLHRINVVKIKRAYSVLIGRMFLQFGLLDSLKERKVITRWEKREMEEMTSSIEKVKRLLELLQTKDHSSFVIFLKLLDLTCQKHLVNYLMSSGDQQPSFNDNWPLSRQLRDHMARNHSRLVRLMSLNRKIEVDEFGEPFVNKEDKDEIAIDRSRDRDLPHQLDLISLLYAKKCITDAHKEHFEKQPNGRRKNEELLVLLDCGSIDTYRTTVDYFQYTEQNRVLDILLPPYDFQRVRSLEIKVISGITWLKENIYVTCSLSNKILIYDDQNSFQLVGDIEVKELKNPRDVTASEKSNCLFISDEGNECVWKVQLPDRQVAKWIESIQEPYTLSLTSLDQLLVTRGASLELYASELPELEKPIPLPNEILNPIHAIQTSSGHFVLCHSVFNGPNQPVSWAVSQLSVTGEILRTYPSDGSSLALSDGGLVHLAVDGDDRIFVVDWGNRIILINSQMTNDQDLLSREEFDHNWTPARICFSRTRQQIAVVHKGSVDIFA